MTQFRTFLEMVSRTRIQLRKVGVLRVGQPIGGTDGRGRTSGDTKWQNKFEDELATNEERAGRAGGAAAAGPSLS